MRSYYIGACGTKSIWHENGLNIGFGKTRGGCVLIRNNSDFVIQNGFYALNHVQMDGGCIYLLDCHYVIIRENVFMFNKAKWGGAIYLEQCSNIWIEENRFVSNLAIRDGGAISLSGCKDVVIRKNTFRLNVAFRLGSKIDIYNCERIITEF